MAPALKSGLLLRLTAAWRFLERRADSPRYPLLRDALLAAALLVMGGACALIVLAPWERPAAPIASVSVDDLTVETGDPRPAELVKLARGRLHQKLVLKGPDFEHETTWANLGAAADMSSLGRILEELAAEDSPASKHARNLLGDDSVIPETRLPVSLVSESAVESLVLLKDLIDEKPRSARFNFAEEGVDEERNGRSLDVYATLAALDRALEEGAAEVPMVVEEVPAAVTKKELEGIEVSEVAGFYETPYSRMRKDRDRTHNVKLGASMLDGHVIMPGQRFSFNEEVGERSEARGFRYAPVIAGGTIVEGMGGGTCQVASTLYAASFFAGLIIEDRQPHSRPSSYIKLGLDATVSYPDLDLKLRNPMDYPVVIHFTVTDGIARVEIRAKERPYTVTLLRKIIGTRPFPVRVIDDSKLPRGTEIITQLGVPGYTVRRSKIIERDKVGYRFQSVDKYPPTVQFVHKGISNPADLKDVKDPPKPDGHKPYRASSSLRMVQGPDGLWSESNHE